MEGLYLIMAQLMTLQWCISAFSRKELLSICFQSHRRALILRSPHYFVERSLSPKLMTSTSVNSYSVTQQSEEELKAIFEKKRILRLKIRRTLKAMDHALRSDEDNAIQSFVLEAPWFKSSQRLCAYISCSALREVDTSRLLSEILNPPIAEDGHSSKPKKKLYVPRVEDKNSHMRMLHILRMDDLIANSMNILEPAPVDSTGEREDGVAFDKSGRRLGRGGGYYDTFLKNYQELAKARNWKQPLLVALSYSPQIMEQDIIPVTSNDIPIDALVSPAGVIPINSNALNR